MSDFLVDLGQNATARQIVRTLGLPIPMPQKLRRAKGPWEARPLQDQDVLVSASHGGELQDAIATALASAGANPWIVGEPAEAAAYVGPGEAYGRPPTTLARGEVSDDVSPHAILFDATDMRTPAELRALYDLFHGWLPRLRRCGRVLILGRPPVGARTPAAAAAAAALSGFARSVAKEVGAKGATAQAIYVERGADDRLAPLLTFLLSERSAFISGQIFHVGRAVKVTDAPKPVLPLEGKVALVTGAARGIGKATARLLAAEGAHVVVLDRPEDDGPASQTAREIGGSVLLVDVSAEDAPETIASALAESHGGVDIVVHNAGVTRDKTLAKMSPQQWDLTVGVNLSAVVAMTEALLDGPFRDGGRIVCLSSIAGIAGNFGQTNYAASKAGIIGYVEALAPSVAKRGITVNAIAPGFIETRLTDAIPPINREVIRRMSNLSQGGLPQDIAEVVTFLASPGSVGVTGSVIRVCGGNYVGA
ncbi:MAG: 3-oxoacyl-ACP reductase [Deltaproteobacteria bacterium]|nr:3-oxoacyl-ACP reductase [Deltaproteobacteria bacterium]MCB9785208.1 3-oxoacyl-ACP reductase [Deltaproteobacteria bacterium]